MATAAQHTRDEREHDGDGSLRPGERRLLIVLGLPALALALAATIVTTYAPKLIADLTGPAVIGLIIGAEGGFALFVPILAGAWSDRLRTRFGGRIPFLLAGAPLMALALAALPFMTSVVPIALCVMLFFLGYFAFYSPYRALYPDLVRDAVRGRSQGTQKTLREAGLGGALVFGGLLLGIWRPLPFLLAALVIAGVTAVFAVMLLRSGENRTARPERGARVREAIRAPVRMLRDDVAIRRLVLVNGLYEFVLAALKTFVVLYITVGLGRSLGLASGVLAVVAVAAVVGALLAGKLADRRDELWVMRRAAVVYAFGLLVPFFVTSAWAMIAVPFVAVAAAGLMTVPYSLLMGLMPEAEHGLSSGVFDFSRGLGTLAGPVVAGLAVELMRPVLSSTQGYSAIFLVGSIAIFLSIPLARRIPDRAPARAAA